MIRRFLGVSGGHLSAATSGWLARQFADDALRTPDKSAGALLAGGKTRYGCVVCCPEEGADELPEESRGVDARARWSGAEHVLFNCDTIPLKNLPILHPDFRDELTPAGTY